MSDLAFSARLASVRATPSRANDVRTVCRIQFEAHDLGVVDELVELLADNLEISLRRLPPEPTPMELAINGEVLPPSAGRRRTRR